MSDLRAYFEDLAGRWDGYYLYRALREYFK
mgnify:CR=1 FL=1